MSPGDILGIGDDVVKCGRAVPGWEVKSFRIGGPSCDSSRAEPPESPSPPAPPVSPLDQEATLDEPLAAAAWTRETPGEFVDTEGAGEFLGVNFQYVG